MDRKELEKKLIHEMISLFCRKHHDGSPLCPSCLELEAYADKKISRCPYGDQKTSCSKCTTHCYAKNRAEEMKKVMRYSGPRIMLNAPLLTIRYLCYKRRAEKNGGGNAKKSAGKNSTD